MAAEGGGDHPSECTTTTVSPTTTKDDDGYKTEGYGDGHDTSPPDCETTSSKPDHTKPTYETTIKPPHETTTTAKETSTTKPPTPGLFSVKAVAFCGSDFLPEIAITFGNRPDLDGQRGVLSFSTGGSVFLTFQSNTTVNIPYPNTTQNVNLIYSLGPETATASVTYPGDCSETTTTRPRPTTTTAGGGGSTSTSSSSSTTTINGVTTTIAVTSTTSNGVTTTSTTISPPGTTTTTVRPVVPPGGPTTTAPAATTTTLPETFAFGAATSACRAEVPVIVIDFQNLFPSLAGRTGTLTMSDVNGNVVSTQPLVYQPGAHVEILYPGTTVNPDGSIADVPGWILQPNGLWVRDPSDEFLREGINLTYTVNPTATAFVTYRRSRVAGHRTGERACAAGYRFSSRPSSSLRPTACRRPSDGSSPGHDPRCGLLQCQRSTCLAVGDHCHRRGRPGEIDQGNVVAMNDLHAPSMCGCPVWLAGAPPHRLGVRPGWPTCSPETR